MGLKTTNYTTKSTGIILPEAYAVLGDLVVNRKTNSARAVFLVQASRENTQNYKPLDEISISFTWNRKTDPAKMAYDMAKTEVKTYDKYDEETGSIVLVTEYGLLHGWEDDIVE